jgi:hypothetical protein
MANPIKAVKAIGRAVGGITGKGAKQVNPVYRQSYRQKEVRIKGEGEKIEMLRAKQILRQAVDEGYLKKPADTAKGNKRGLKAANKPVSKNNEKVYSTDIRAKKMGVLKPGQTSEYTRGTLKKMQPARPNRVRGGNLRGE